MGQNKNKNHHSNSSVFQTSQNSGQYHTSSQAAQSAAPVHNPAAGSYQFGVSDRKVISTGNAYGDELQRQVAEKKERQAAEKRKRDNEDAKVEDYDPFGRGGAGAPLKTASGSVVADLRKLHKLNEVNDDPSISKAQREDQLNYNFDESYGSKKNFTYRDYLEEQIQIKNKKKAASKKAKEDEELVDREKLVKQRQQMKDEYNQELIAEQKKNDDKEKEKNAKFAAIASAAESAENSKKDVIRQ